MYPGHRKRRRLPGNSSGNCMAGDKGRTARIARAEGRVPGADGPHAGTSKHRGRLRTSRGAFVQERAGLRRALHPCGGRGGPPDRGELAELSPGCAMGLLRGWRDRSGAAFPGSRGHGTIRGRGDWPLRGETSARAGLIGVAHHVDPAPTRRRLSTALAPTSHRPRPPPRR